MKKSNSIFFKPIGGSAPLSIYYYEMAGNLGDATEANNENGVGWFSPNGELLAVQFDDVEEKKDHQLLEFNRYRVEVFVNKGKVSHSLELLGFPKNASRSPKKRAEEDAA
jgi:hypothetical protein